MGIAVIFPGQGTHHPGMFDLALRDPAAAPYVERACASLGIGLDRLGDLVGRGMIEDRLAQPLFAALGYAVWASLRPRVPAPAVFAGYSLGELIAYACAGACDFDTLLSLADARARVMDAAVTTHCGMVAVSGIPLKRMKRIAAETGAFVAIVNGDDHLVLGGEHHALDTLVIRAGAQEGVRVHVLPVSIPSHTPLMAAAGAEYEKILAGSRLGAPALPVVSSVENRVVYRREDAVRTLALHLCRPLQWAGCMQTMAEMGPAAFLEIGSGNSLVKIAQRLLPGCTAHAIEEFNSLDGVAAWMRKLSGTL